MTTATDQRQSLRQLAEQQGWRRKELDRLDIFSRGQDHVHVLWQGTSAISGAGRYQDPSHVLLSYTRDMAKIHDWLTA